MAERVPVFRVRYLGPTSSRGARLVVESAIFDKRHHIARDYSLSFEQDAERAAREVAALEGLPLEPVAVGFLRDGSVVVFLRRVIERG